MTVIILHDGKAWAMGASPESVGEDCRRLQTDSPMKFIADAETRMRFICRAWELLGSERSGER